MIERYSSPAMRAVWSPERRLLYLFDAACVAADVTDRDFDLGGKLRDRVLHVRSVYHADLDSGRSANWLREWERLEQHYDHDIAAFVEMVRNGLDEPERQFFHLGRTSSDLTDTALAFAVTDSQHLVEVALRQFATELAASAWRYKDAAIVGRTHGQLAEITTIGRRFALSAVQVWDYRPNPYRAAKMTGPVGTNSPAAAKLALEHVGLRQRWSSQIVPRVHLARLASEIQVATVPISDLAMMIRLGAREGDSWCSEGRSTSARGSSSMPTKRNPIRSEKVSGLCTWIRSTAGALIESSAGLWEERDISHSSVERLALPDLFAALEHVYVTMTGVVRNLEVRLPAERIEVRSAEALASLVVGGVLYNDAYGEIRREGPEMALRDAGIDPEVARTIYDSSTEPDLWSFIRNLASLRPMG